MKKLLSFLVILLLFLVSIWLYLHPGHFAASYWWIPASIGGIGLLACLVWKQYARHHQSEFSDTGYDTWTSESELDKDS